MATVAARAPSTGLRPLQTLAIWVARARHALEHGLEAERDQLPLWLPVALGAGIAGWFVLDDPKQWIAAMLALAGIALAAIAVGQGGRAGRAVAIAASRVSRYTVDSCVIIKAIVGDWPPPCMSAASELGCRNWPRMEAGTRMRVQIEANGVRKAARDCLACAAGFDPSEIRCA